MGIEHETPCPIPCPTPAQIVVELDKYVIGHEHAKQMLATAVYQHHLQCSNFCKYRNKVQPDNHCIIAGPSGVGKSAMIEVLSNYLHMPVYQIDCTTLTPNGYKGRNLQNVIDDLQRKFVSDEITTPGIVVWEEIDKIRFDGSEAGRYMQMTQADALRFLDGALLGEDNDFDTSQLLHIGCGAFAGLDNIITPPTSPQIGFQSPPASREDTANRSPTNKLKPEHLIKFGFMPEFVGRFSRFAILDPLDIVTMRRILTDAKNNVFLRKLTEFVLHGVSLQFTDSAITLLAEQAMDHPLGARALRMILNELLHEFEFALPDLAASDIHGIRYDAQAVLGRSNPQIILQEHKIDFFASQEEIDNHRSFDDCNEFDDVIGIY